MPVSASDSDIDDDPDGNTALSCGEQLEIYEWLFAKYELWEYVDGVFITEEHPRHLASGRDGVFGPRCDGSDTGPGFLGPPRTPHYPPDANQ